MAGAGRPGEPPGGLGLGLSEILQGQGNLPFRALHQDTRRPGLGVAAVPSGSPLASLIRRPAAAPEAGTGGPGKSRQQQGRTPGGAPDGEGVIEGSQDSQVWGDPNSHELEFDAGVSTAPHSQHLPKPIDAEKERPTALASVLKIANKTATKAKEKLSMVSALWSPKRSRVPEPVVPSLPTSSSTARRNNHAGKRDKSINILAIARRAGKSKMDVERLEEGFAANSSRKAKRAIRSTVMAVFREAKGGKMFPPTPDKVKTLASVLKAANYRAAGNYLGEYKLMAVESGHQWSDQLERVLKLCKRSTARAAGPKTKAAEVPTQETGEHFAIRIDPDCRKKVPLAAELFDFGTIWMLREIELALVAKDHIKLNFETKRVTFTLPMSKTDQEGNEVRRVLQCLCPNKICDVSCPFFVAVRLLDKMIALGWDKASRIPRSLVILEYAAEALESLPVNLGHTFATGDSSNSNNAITCPPREVNAERLEEIKVYLLTELEAAKVDNAKSLQALDEEVAALKSRDEKLGNCLPPAVQAVASKITHHNMELASCSPPHLWRTLCGWYYHRSDFVFVTKVVLLECLTGITDVETSSQIMGISEVVGCGVGTFGSYAGGMLFVLSDRAPFAACALWSLFCAAGLTWSVGHRRLQRANSAGDDGTVFLQSQTSQIFTLPSCQGLNLMLEDRERAHSFIGPEMEFRALSPVDSECSTTLTSPEVHCSETSCERV
eukprot:s29_g33.t1